MAKSQESFSKKEREKKRLKKRKDKQQRKEERKATSGKGNEFSYVDEYGQLTDTPPDPSKRIKVDAESIVIGIPKKEEEEEVSPIREGRVSFFNSSKGYGFIKETHTGDQYFVHINGLLEEVRETDKVSFELERGMKGMNAVRVKKIK